MQRKKKWIIRLFISVIVCLTAMIWAFLSIRHLPKYDYSIDDWKSENAVYRDNGFSIDEGIKDSGKSIEFLWGPYMPLEKGSYTANIHYSASEDQMCIATASGGASELFNSSDGILSKYFHTVSYQFETVDDVPEFQLVIRYSGIGDFTVHSISISPNSNQPKRIAVEIITIVLLCNLVVLFFEQREQRKKTILALVGITVLVSLPLWIYGITAGYDLGVHYLRIEAILQAIRSGQFPARISAITLYGLGYPFSIYYNDLFLYFPAFLRLMGFPVVTAYKIYVFAVNLATVLISYYSFKHIFNSRKTGLLLTLIYAAASYRLLNVYIRAAVGEFTAQAFLPLLVLAVYRIWFQKASSFKAGFHNAILMAAAMSGIIGSHILTLIMVCFVLVLLCLFLIRKTLQKQTMLTLIGAVVLTVLLNLYFLTPFMDYYFNVPTQISEAVDHEVKLIQGQGVYPAQFFAFFQNVNGTESSDVADRMQLTPGPVLMILFVYALISSFTGKRGRMTNFLLIFSSLMLFLSSNIFPWDWLAMHFKPWNILTQIQYPCRFLVLAILFLTLLAGCVLRNEKRSYVMAGIAALSVLMAFWFMSSLFEVRGISNIYDTSGVSPEWTCCEQYMLAGSSKDNLTAEAEGENMENVTVLSRDANTMQLTCRAGNREGTHQVDVPIYNYPGYHVTDMDGNVYPLFSGEENHINFTLPEGFDGTITVAFADPFHWKVSIWISVGTVLAIFLYFLWSRKQQNRSGGLC